MTERKEKSFELFLLLAQERGELCFQLIGFSKNPNLLLNLKPENYEKLFI